MTGLVFKKLWIVSKLEKAARTVSFQSGMNILTGENDVGKSTLIKSLYHSIGADAPQMNNTRWKRAKAFYCSEIFLNGATYFIVRDGKHFGVFDAQKGMISKHSGISTEGGIASFICEQLNFNIELEKSADGKLGRAGPAFYFLPFYVDQDAGWTKSWESFSGLQQFTSFRKNMIEYHMGIRPQSYYDAKKKEMEFLETKSTHQAERNVLSTALATFQKRSSQIQVSLDPVAFKEELDQLVDSYNLQRARQQDALTKVKDIRNERNAIDTDIAILRRSISELTADYEYAARLETPDIVGCPTCGTEFENSFQERFGLLDDVDYCRGILDQRQKARIEVTEKLDAAEREYRSVGQATHEMELLLNRKKSEVTLRDIVASEGNKEMVVSLSADIVGKDESIEEVQKAIDGLKADLKLDSKRKKEILEYYQSRMKEYLNALNVFVLEESDYAEPTRVIKNNALGSDLPRALLAQYFALLHTMKKFGGTKVCPLIIDSPQQQEQDTSNLGAIFKFIFSKALDGQQLILGTISTEAVPDEIIPKGANRIVLSNEKYSILRRDQFSEAIADVGEMHELLLSK
ncbi:hypothetical protein [Thalassobius sp. MITS945101]|uniref:hypothetical protein n=1 Tax=Thalassobius sp. MITS945101 TaxID=3096994 RepID=UPI00399C21ED